MIKKIINLLLGYSRSPGESLARQIAERCLADVCEQVTGHTVGMSVSEARGYVRARAAQFVLRETRIAIANSVDVELSDMASIARQATEQLIPQVIRKTHLASQQASRVAA